ncbi:MAG: FAD-dependent oxidoreductase [Moraxellaceae bacterium]|nr:FAD-dependent oxidoreductase [Pseudobdellovibrionaceae bacterium]
MTLNLNVSNPDQIFEAVILGAGISGLTLAHRLSKKTNNFLVVEKSRGIGGRLATRRDGENIYDHGAQFYKISPKHELAFDQMWMSCGLVKNWFTLNEVQYQTSQKGMTGLAKFLADGKSVDLSREIALIKIENNLVILTCTDQSVIKCQKLFITAPLPQAVILLERSGFEIPQNIKDVKYAHALVALFELEDLSDYQLLPYQEKISDTIFSVSQQNTKFEKNSPTLTVAMTPDWSLENFNSSDEKNLVLITVFLQKYLMLNGSKLDAVILKSQLKKWRYSHPINPLTCGYVKLNSQIVLAGDGFSGGSINHAVKSGLSIPLD